MFDHSYTYLLINVSEPSIIAALISDLPNYIYTSKVLEVQS